MPTVLVVDDSPVDRRLAGGLLEKHFECAIRYAGDGKEALQQIVECPPDLVLTDLLMPQMNGLDLVTAVKNECPFVPIILMTAQGSEDIAAQALRRGAASYVPKRRLADDLPATVQRVLLGSLEDRGHSPLMHYMETCETTFMLANDLTLVRSVVNYLHEMLRCLPLGDETERLRVGVALEEALRNAYYHGNLEIGPQPDISQRDELARQRLLEVPYRDRHIHVRARISRQEAVFTIRDDGPGFDASKLPTNGELPDDSLASGRGVVLMRTIMDAVSYNPAGNEVTLLKRRAQAPSPDDLQEVN